MSRQSVQRRAVVAGVGAFGTSVVLSACQDASTIGVRNGCDAAIEAVADESPSFPDYLPFTRIAPGDVEQVIMVSKDWQHVWVWAGVPGDERQSPTHLSVLRSEAAEGADGEPDYVIDMSGDYCP